MEVRHIHARFHYESGAFAPAPKFDGDAVFEAAATCRIFWKMGVGIQFSAPHPHQMMGNEERLWHTLRDNASAMMQNMYVPSSMWSCAVNIVAYLRNRTLYSVVLLDPLMVYLLPS
jgi:hypothetical protein